MKNFIGIIIVALISFLLLSIVQVRVENPMILAERFFENGGWVEIAILSLFAGLLYHKMSDPQKTKQWRTFAWVLFSVVFFSQLCLGLFGYEKFLMTGKLHLPIPGVIVGGSIYRMEISFMPILLLSTIILTGPAWCSQLCYFGSFDYLAAGIKKKPSKMKKFMLAKLMIFSVFIIGVVLLRLLDASIEVAAWAGGIFGIIGLLVLLILSSIKGNMIHCVTYCPIGLIVSVTKYINPFRMYIDHNCDKCMKCTSTCRYMALTKENIDNKKPGITCTYCGDCITSCHTSSIKYRFFSLSPEKARKVYLGTTIVVYVIFLGLARI